MRYLGLAPMAQDALLADLQAMPDYLAAAFTGLSATDAAVQRLLGEVDPVLADFDGARIARERAYRSRSLVEGLAAFRQARGRNLAWLRALTAEEWPRTGFQGGVGPIALCDVPAMMAEHDAGHRQEIADWRSTRETR